MSKCSIENASRPETFRDLPEARPSSAASTFRESGPADAAGTACTAFSLPASRSEAGPLPDLLLTDGRVVTPDGVVRGDVLVVGGRIVEVREGGRAVGGLAEEDWSAKRFEVEDLDGDYLVPGLIEVHTDNLETQLEPRPGVFWPSPLAAVMAHDVQIAGAGITTVLDAVSLGEYHSGGKRRKMLLMSLEALSMARSGGVLRAEHLLHLRCEVADPGVLEMFAPNVDDPGLRLVSLMDHTPGQRQWRDHAMYRKYYSSKNWNDADYESVVADLKAVQEQYADRHRRAIVAACRERCIPLASHDDTDASHIDEGVRDGVAVSEFPTTMEAARLAREHGIKVVMGAPNVVRGGSHSGNVSALELAREGLLDILSSDYVPSSLLGGAFKLHRELGWPLERAVATVSAAPAVALDLDDRGRIAPGLRADLVRVREVDGVPVVRRVWRMGRRVC